MNVDQTLFNVIIAVAGILGGWVLNTVWGAVKDLQKNDKDLADKVAAIEVLVAGKYITRDEFGHTMEKVNNKLDLIVDKLNGKADKLN